MDKKGIARNLLVFSLALATITWTGCGGLRLFGEMTDPELDSIGPDFIYASVTVAEGEVLLSVRFAPGTFVQSTTSVTFLFDTDQNPATGHPGVDAGGIVDNGIIGSEFLVKMGGDYLGGDARVFSYAGSLNSFDLTDTAATVVYLDDGLDAAVTLSMLGRDDGRLSFKATVQTQVGGGGYTGILDRITDEGVPPGTTTSI